jgi:hypothetical protein
MLKQVLKYFCEALRSIGDSWMMNQEWMDKATYNMYNNSDQRISSEQAGMIQLFQNLVSSIFLSTFSDLVRNKMEQVV